MARFYFLLLLLLPVLGNAQQKPFNYKEVEARVKKYIYNNPDSTKAIIQEALRYKNLHDTIKGNLHNIYGIYYGTVNKKDSALYYYNRALGNLKDYPKIKTRPLMNAANIYRDKGETEKAFELLEQALQISKDYKMRAYEATIYGSMSSIYQVKQDFEKGVEYSVKAVNILKQLNVPGQLATAQQKLANTYLKMRNFTFARDMYLETLATFKKQKDDVNYSGTLLNYAESLLHLSQYDAAVAAIQESIGYLKKIKNNENMAVAYSKMGNIQRIQKKFDKAVSSYDKAFIMLCQSNSIFTVVIAAEYTELLNTTGKYQKAVEVAQKAKSIAAYLNAGPADKLRLDIALAEAQGKTNSEDAGLAGLRDAVRVKDSLYSTVADDNTHEVLGKFQAEVQREKNLALAANNKLLQQDAARENARIWLMGGATLAVILLVLLILRGSVLKNRLQQQQLSTAAADVLRLQSRQQHEKELSIAQKSMIDEKQRELTSTALRMASFQDSINEIIEKCDNRAIVKVSEIKSELVYITRQQDYWKQFETRFNSLHPEFGNNLQLRYGKLTKNDVEFCSLLKLNLSNKEIASLLQISHESAITKKYRIKKKMEITSDEEFETLLAVI